MANIEPATISGAVRPAALQRVLRPVVWIYLLLAGAFALSVVVQILIAGMAIFVHPENWVRHIMFVHMFEFLPILMLLVSWVGRLPARQKWQSVGLFGMVFLQYFTANMRAVLPFAAATHPLVGMAIAWLALVVLKEAWTLRPTKPMQIAENQPASIKM